MTEKNDIRDPSESPDSPDFLGRLDQAASGLLRSGKQVVGAADLNLFSKRVRIAVAGASRSGKTVLLTSLLDHLRNHNPQRFRLRPAFLSANKAPQITHYDVLEVTDEREAFPYEAFRKSLIQEACWPRKTRDSYQYRLKIYRDDSVLDRLVPARFSTTLTFLDFPGERMADAPMTSLGFSDWSDYPLSALPSGDRFAPLNKAFREALADAASSEETLLAAYKRILAERLRQFNTAISPSTFALCPSGSSPRRGAGVEELVHDRNTGQSKDDQFCPLDAVARKRRPEMASRFEQFYEAYRKVLILPLYKALAASDQLCLLVNIPEILQSGVGAYNDHVDLFRHVIGYCNPKTNLYADLLKRFGKSVGKVFIDDKYRPGGIENIAFVATQADRVSHLDIDRLGHLVQEIQIHCTRGLPHLDVRMECFSCVAVQATRPTDDGNLQGRLRSQAGSTPNDPGMEAYGVSRLPEEWPSGWNPEAFVFPEVLPRFSENRNFPPKQSGLDKLFNFLTS